VKEKVQELGQTAKQAILNPNSSTEVPAVSQDNGNEGSDSRLDATVHGTGKTTHRVTLHQLQHTK